MDIQTLKIYNSVAKLGSFSAAAQDLNYAQSNISTKIQNLENEFNTVLFYRHNRGITLTSKGELLLDYSEEILNLVKKTEEAMKDDGIAKGLIKIGSLETVASLYLPTLLAKYHNNNSEVTFSIKTGTSRENIDDVLNRKLDGAFVSGNIEHENLEIIKFKDERLQIVTASTCNNISSWQHIENKALLVFNEGCSYRHLLEHLLSENGIISNKLIEFNSLGALISSLCSGIGISLLPKAITLTYENDGIVKTFDVPSDYTVIPTFFIYRKDTYLNTAFREFINILS